MILDGVGTYTAKQAWHLEKILHDKANEARRNGFQVPDDMVDLLRDVRRLAERHRMQVSEVSEVDLTPSGEVAGSRRTLSPSELGQLAGISGHGVAEALRRGRIPGEQVGRRWQIDETDALEWIAQRGQGDE